MDDAEIEDIESNLNNILNMCGWSKEFLFMQEMKVPCPLDGNHMIPESLLKDHIERCKWLKHGYSREEMEGALPSSSFSYADDVSVPLILDKELLSKITSGSCVDGSNSGYSGYISNIAKPIRDVPRTMDRFTVEFTPQERLAIYDHIVGKAKEVKKSSGVKLEDLVFDFEKKDDKGDKEKSLLEILKEQRDYKRRRPTYRAKNVHITKKSYTEVMKEVIGNQMSYLTEIQKEKTSSSNNTKQDSPCSDHIKEEICEEDNSKGADDVPDHGDYRSHRHSKKSREKKHHKHKRSRSRSRDRYSDSHKRNKSSHRDSDRKRRKH